MMRATVFTAPHQVGVENVPDASLQAATDVIVRVTKAAICGSDLHIYHHGDTLGVSPGCRIGHEFVGVVEEVGAGVRAVRPGDKVLAPFWISCGRCDTCRDELYTSCPHGSCFGLESGWAAGGPVEGCQSEYVRVPLADGTLELVPDSLSGPDSDTKVLPLGDVCRACLMWRGAGSR